MASLEHRRERMHSAPSKALRAGRVCHVQLCTCQALYSPCGSYSTVRWQTPQAGSTYLPAGDQGLNTCVARCNRRLTRTTQSVSAHQSHLAFGNGVGGAGKRERLREVEASFWPTPTKNSYSKCQQKSPCAIHNSIPVSLSHYFSPPSGLHLNIRFLSINVFPS